MQVQITFANAIVISTGTTNDQLSIQFLDLLFIQSLANQSVFITD